MATTITEDAYTDDAWRLSVKRVTKKRKLQNYVLLFRFFHCFVWRFENFEHAFMLVYLCTACMGGATIGPGGDMTPPLSDAGGTGGDIIWE